MAITAGSNAGSGGGAGIAATILTCGGGGGAIITGCAAGIAGWFAQRPAWTTAQRWFMGSVLSGLALRMALERR